MTKNGNLGDSWVKGSLALPLESWESSSLLALPVANPMDKPYPFLEMIYLL